MRAWNAAFDLVQITRHRLSGEAILTVIRRDEKVFEQTLDRWSARHLVELLQPFAADPGEQP